MTEGVAGFVAGLRALGYEPRMHNESTVVFSYAIEVGPLAGDAIELGFVVPSDWPRNCPGGPQVSPHLLPLHPDQRIPHPDGGVHASGLGPTWQYWSRPYPGWAGTDHSVTAYLAHIRRLLDTLPERVRRAA